MKKPKNKIEEMVERRVELLNMLDEMEPSINVILEHKDHGLHISMEQRQLYEDFQQLSREEILLNRDIRREKAKDKT